MILIEENFDDVKMMEASVGEGKKSYLSGVFMEANNRNRNGRIYDLEEMKAEVKKVNDRAKVGRYVLGELDHPNNLTVKLENVSHKIVELRMEGNLVYGKAEILDAHPKGAILKSLVESGIQVGVSSRGAGQMNEDTGKVSNFNLVTVDAVATPSCRSAYPQTIEEQLQLYKRGEIITDLAEAQCHDPVAQKYFEMEMRRFFETLGRNK